MTWTQMYSRPEPACRLPGEASDEVSLCADNGAHWRPSSRGLSARSIGDLTESRGWLFATTAPEGIQASRNGGRSWQPLGDANHPEGLLLRFLAAGPDALYALEQIGDVTPRVALVRSTDGGASWPETGEPGLGGTHLESRSTGLPANSTTDFAFDPRRAGTIYAATTEGVFKTTNGGASWTRGSRGLPAGADVSSIAVDPGRRDVVYAGLPGQVYRSVNAGRTWQRIGAGLPFVAPVVEILPSASDPRRIYAVSADHGIYWFGG
jgi:photosystem II stability/assembly factor-like uncharacterized protein